MRRQSFDYPSAEELIELNKKLLEKVKVKKSDRHEVLSRSYIEAAIESSRASDGDVYDKTVVLLVELTKRHGFASGNRRTAFVAAQVFLEENGGEFRAQVMNPRTMQGIREGFYSHEEIKEWIKGHGIREFNRFAPKKEWADRRGEVS